MKLFAPLYERTLAWSSHPKAPQLLTILSFFEAIIFPVPPEVMLAPMSLVTNGTARLLLKVAGVTAAREADRAHTVEEIETLIEESGEGGLIGKHQAEILVNLPPMADSDWITVTVRDAAGNRQVYRKRVDTLIDECDSPPPTLPAP